MGKLRYAIAASYDTETCNIQDGDAIAAYPVLYIFDDLRDRDLSNYDYGDDNILFFRSAGDAVDYIQQIIMWGLNREVIPIICAYNLMFDATPLLKMLYDKGYTFDACAQSSTNVYTLDLYLMEQPVLRFWDTFFLEQRGLSAMGDTCGLEKASGDWDYDLIRTPDTPLTEQELHYAGRDVQVIPAYLRFLLESNDWLTQEMLGSSVLTKTSLVRRMAKHEIGKLRIPGSRYTVGSAMLSLCKQEDAKGYDQYAIRKACFRGGLAFTAASTASRVVSNVASLDVTSMHHAFLNGRYVPVKFRKCSQNVIQKVCEQIVDTKQEMILDRYHMPFPTCMHAKIAFANIRLKSGSCFERWGIGIVPSAKFKTVLTSTDEWDSLPARVAEEAVRANGWIDKALRPEIAYGKLMSADGLIIHVTEIELWCLSQVYEWDDMTALAGETSVNCVVPPDYITLQSNILFARKNDAKIIDKHYREGVPYDREIPDSVPAGIADMLRSGSASNKFVSAWYGSTVKGQFNGIYGTQAQDIRKPGWTFDDVCEMHVDKDSVPDPDTYGSLDVRNAPVLYTYGMRIAGGSRMHLIIAMQLLYDALGSRIDVLGGDTDSLKIRCDYDVTDDEMLDALAPLHDAVTRAIDRTMSRVRRNFSDLASSLDHVGCFEVEGCGNSNRYVRHLEAWNKSRIDLDADGHVHITCAGLPQPDGMYNLEDLVEDLCEGDPDKFERIAPLVLGYNVLLRHNICHALESVRPSPTDVYYDKVTDYTGSTHEVLCPQSPALRDADRMLGDTTKPSNLANVIYQQRHYDYDVDTSTVVIDVDENGPHIWIESDMLDLREVRL